MHARNPETASYQLQINSPAAARNERLERHVKGRAWRRATATATVAAASPSSPGAPAAAAAPPGALLLLHAHVALQLLVRVARAAAATTPATAAASTAATSAASAAIPTAPPPRLKRDDHRCLRRRRSSRTPRECLGQSLFIHKPQASHELELSGQQFLASSDLALQHFQRPLVLWHRRNDGRVWVCKARGRRRRGPLKKREVAARAHCVNVKAGHLRGARLINCRVVAAGRRWWRGPLEE